MIPLLYQLSYTGTEGKDSVIPSRCPVEPTSSGAMDVRNRFGVLETLKNLWLPESCRLCAQPPAPPDLLPPRRFLPEDFPLCESCAVELETFETICGRCLHLPEAMGSDCTICREQVPLRPLRALGPHTGTLRKWILRAKHGDRPDLARALARAMAQNWSQTLPVTGHNGNRFPLSTAAPLLVPVPRSLWRILLKGQPLTALLTDGLALDLDLQKRSLLRQNGITGQAGKSAQQRRSLAPHRFNVKKNARKKVEENPGQNPGKSHLLDRLLPAEKPSRVILVDDVMTTGATLKMATRALEEAGHRVVAWMTASVTPP